MIEIPKTINEAIASLNSLGRLLTAKQWERAAIVRAFTREGERGEGGPGRKQTGSSTALLVDEFAALGIAGLKSDKTVRIYRSRWRAAIDAGKATEVRPGDAVELPDMPWPPTEPRSNDDRTISKLRDPNFVKRALEDPQARKVTIETIAKNPDTSRRMDDEMAKRRLAPLPPKAKPIEADPPSLLLVKFHRLHDTIDEIIQLVLEGRAVVNISERDALIKEVKWLRNALDHVEAGLSAGSLDAELARLVGRDSQ